MVILSLVSTRRESDATDGGKDANHFRRSGRFPLAAALTGKAGKGPIVAIVSGGNIDLAKFSELIATKFAVIPSAARNLSISC